MVKLEMSNINENCIWFKHKKKIQKKEEKKFSLYY